MKAPRTRIGSQASSVVARKRARAFVQLVLYGLLFSLSFGFGCYIAPRSSRGASELLPVDTLLSNSSDVLTRIRTQPREVLIDASSEAAVSVYTMPRWCDTRGAKSLSKRPSGFDPAQVMLSIGISSIDNVAHAELRSAQRDTWFTYGDVATAAKQFKGPVFVEYFIGRAYENDYKFSAALVQESSTHGDILAMELKEVKRRAKAVLTRGVYGKGPEVIMSLKSMAFYCHAEKSYPNLRFVAKADDDQFIRIPMIMATVNVLPNRGAIWATRTSVRPKRSVRRRICGTSGMWIGMSPDVLHLVNSLPEIQQYAAIRIEGERVLNETEQSLNLLWMYSNTALFAEDVVPAAVVDFVAGSGNESNRMNLGYKIQYYSEPPCRLHNHNGETSDVFLHHVNPFSMIVHHASRTEQEQYMRFFPEDEVYPVSFSPAPTDICYGAPSMVNDVCSRREREVHL